MCISGISIFFLYNYELHCVGLKRYENKLDRRNAFMILEGNQVVFSLC